MTTTLTERPPLVPTESGERQFYHYKRNGTIKKITLSDALALWRICHGQDLWPCEWGMRRK